MAGAKMKLKEEQPRKTKRNSPPFVDNLETLSKDELISRLMEMKLYVEEMENRNNLSDTNTEDGRLRQHQSESQRRENVLFMRLTAKEQEVQDFLSQLEELRTSLGSLRNVLVDPVVNSIFLKMREELKQTKEKMEQGQRELTAWTFTPDSTTGKRLMAKCRGLIQENEELGKMIEGGRLAHLEGKLEIAKKQVEELSAGQSEVDEFLMELDEDMEGLQATVVYLQKQLETVREENQHLRTLLAEASPTGTTLESQTRDRSGITQEGSVTPSLDEPLVLTDKLAKHTVSAVRKHEDKMRLKPELNCIKGMDLGELPEGSAEVLENGTSLNEIKGPTPTSQLQENGEGFSPSPVSPPPRKMPRLDNSMGDDEQYSPRSPEVAPPLGVDANLEQEDEEDEVSEENSKLKSAGQGKSTAYRTRKGEARGLFERMSAVVENGLLDVKVTGHGETK